MAHEGAMGIVKERMDLMKALQKDMKTISAMLKGENPLDQALLQERAEAIAKAADIMVTLFPEDGTQGITEAKSTIWDNWDDFINEADAMGLAAQNLSQVAQDQSNRASLSQPFRELSLTCSSCHDSYRVKK
jgi:cytochrome c556